MNADGSFLKALFSLSLLSQPFVLFIKGFKHPVPDQQIAPRADRAKIHEAIVSAITNWDNVFDLCRRLAVAIYAIDTICRRQGVPYLQAGNTLFGLCAVHDNAPLMSSRRCDTNSGDAKSHS